MSDPTAPEPNTFSWPVVRSQTRITSAWGALRGKTKKKHWGLDIGSTLGTGGSPQILAVAPGVVLFRGVSGGLGNPASGGAATGGSGYGNCVCVYHGIDSGNQHIYSMYGHLSAFSVTLGSVVSQGQQVGIMGNTGGSYGLHLHFTIYRTRDGQKLPLPASGTGGLGFFERNVSINPMDPKVSEGANSTTPFLK
jgi:murein DD-endopeptidase MepM/ murein hydrolase activator NlpD